MNLNRRQMVSALAAAPLVAQLRMDAFEAAVRKPGQAAPQGVTAYTSVTEALAAAPADGTRPFRISIGRGVWDEQLVVDKPNIHFIGEDRHESVISFATASGLIAQHRLPPSVTSPCAIIVRAPGFRAERLTMANSFDGLAEMTKPGGLHSHDRAGPQAIALKFEAGCGRADVVDCDIDSYQDTLFTDGGAVRFERCRISGSYDFIFGAGRAWFEGCELLSLPRPVDPVEGYVVAPSTRLSQPWGLVFHRCRLTKAPGTAAASVFLGRPWRPSTTFPDGRYGDPTAAGSAVFLDCWMDDHIAPAGWTEMWYTGRDGNPRTMLQPEEARFSVWRPSGPGVGPFQRGAHLTDAQAAEVTEAAVLGV